MTKPTDSNEGYGAANRRGRMNRSRAVAAGVSATALVGLTAGVALANPAPSHTSKVQAGPDASRQRAATNSGGDSGWVGGNNGGATQDPNAQSGGGLQDPNAGNFNPGIQGDSGGRSNSGGS